MINNSFYSNQELQSIGFNSYGRNVLISKKASIYSPEKISLGSNIRIDDFCILSGNISLGSSIHISAYTALFAGDAGIELDDFSGISPHCSIYAISDDFSGEFMTNSMVYADKRNIISGKVYLGKYTQVGSGCTVLPGVSISTGTVVGAMSLVNTFLPEWKICYGIPVRVVKDRSRNLLALL
jgi:galactoside O-acetyltransferase